MKKTKLSPLGDLFKDSWEVVTRNLLHFFLWGVIGFALFIVLTGVSVAALFGTGAIALSSGGFNMSRLASAAPFLLALFIGIILALIFIASLLNAGYILVASGKGQRLGDVWTGSWKVAFPIFLTGLLGALFVAGAFFFFILPAALFAFFFAFAPYEVVLNKKSGMAALARSYTLVISHFWELLGRFLLLFIIGVGLSYGASVITRNALPFGLLPFVVRILFSWFSICYVFTLYRQVRDTTTGGKSMVWVALVSILGWVFAIFIISAVVRFVASSAFQNLMREWRAGNQRNVNRRYKMMPYNNGQYNLPSGVMRYTPRATP